jgi:heavy metal sensor kinase
LLYLGVSYSLYREIDQFLEGEVHEFMQTVNRFPSDRAALEEAIRAELGSRTQRDLAFRLFDNDGELIVSSQADDQVAPLWAPPEDWSKTPPYFEFRTLWPDGAPYPCRTCSLRVTTVDGRSGTAQAGYSLQQVNESLAMFRRICALGLGLAVCLSLVSGHLMARKTLGPIRALTKTANRINAMQLAERVPTTGSGDELDQLAATLNRMLNRIEHHVVQMQQFTADASHELRSPLAALRGNAEVALTRSRPAEELREVIEDSLEHYDRLARITEDLLLLARADAGQQVVRCEPVRFDLAVKNAIDLYRPLAYERGINLTFANKVNVWCRGDATRLRQLVGNLIDNAIKYSDKDGSVTVALGCANGLAGLSITDTGQGIPPEHLPRIFDRFYRADQARSASRRGAGLGLSICKMIADAHGGEIRVSSTPGSGTTVAVAIPSATPSMADRVARTST